MTDLVKKTSQAQVESTWTKEEALEWAEEYFKAHRMWPSRRFRVEGSRAGNSKLLSERKAYSAMAKYGGKMIELIPSRRKYVLTNSNTQLAQWRELHSK